MEADKLEKIKESIGNIFHSFFVLLGTIINIFITVFIMFGAAAGIILLYKMFPETALILMKPLLVVSLVIIKIIQITIAVLFLLSIIYLVMYVIHFFDEQQKRLNKKRELDRKKFMDEVVRRLNKGNKK